MTTFRPQLCAPRLLTVFTAFIGLLLGTPAQAQELLVSAASSLTQAFQAIGQAFVQSQPGSSVRFNFAASGTLLAQIQQGAPVDVLATADQDTMERAARAGLLAPGSRQNFTHNALVVIVPMAAMHTPQSLHDLTQNAYLRIASGSPGSVPAGRYAQQAVQQAGLSAALQTRWVFATNVRQVLRYVARGEVDAGLVYRSDALSEANSTRIAFTVATPKLGYPLAQLANSPNPGLGQQFIQFVRSVAGQAILAQHGFAPL